MMMIAALTGHRPERCADESTVRALVAAEYAAQCPDIVICGMAAGFDLWAAHEANRLDIPIVAAVPWAGHGPRAEDKKLYMRILESAAQVIYVDRNEKYSGPQVYHNRNKWMVDHADYIVAYWDGTPKGGTYSTVVYAASQDKLVRNLWE